MRYDPTIDGVGPARSGGGSFTRPSSDWTREPKLREAPCLLSRFIICAVIVAAVLSLAAAPADSAKASPEIAEAVGSETPVADAARSGDLAALRELLERGEDVDVGHGDGMTALHWAAYRGDSEMLALLLEAGASLEGTTRVGEYTPLLVAARTGHGEAVVTLVEAGANPAASTSTGVTALHFAAGSGQVGAIQALVAAGAPLEISETANGQTPLVFAADRGRTEAVEALLDAGADPSTTTRVTLIADLQEEDRVESRERRERMAALKAAQEEAEAGSEEEGEPETATSEEAAIQTGDLRGATGEEAAASADGPADRDVAQDGESESEEESSEEGEDDEDEEEEPAEQPLGYGDLVGGTGGLTALHHAAREGHAEAVMALVAGGADPNVPSIGDGSTPMLLAAINGHFDLALELMEAGADPSIGNHAEITPLWAAINVQWAPKALYPQPKNHQRQSVDYLGFMERLLEAGVDPNAQVNRHVWFMSYNFDLLGVNVRGASPFWRAAYALDVPAMRLLVAYGADPHLPTRKPPERPRRGDPPEDHSGLEPVPTGGPAVYPIHAASGAGYGQDYAANSHEHAPDAWVPAVRYLVEELGADVNARDQFGYNAIHHAAARGDNDLIRYLVEQGADPLAVARNGRTTVDMANGPIQRVEPYPATIALLESMGAKNNNNCRSCE